MIELIEPDWPAPPSVSAFCTTRTGGFSQAPYDSLNLALHVGDDAARVRQNREALNARLELPSDPCWMRQTHSKRAITLERERIREADAAITREAGQVAVVMTADCLPILICNQAGDEVAAVHAGWRGLQAGVIQSALAAMKSPPDQLMAWIGPGISLPCFEVGDEVRDAFKLVIAQADSYFEPHGPGHWLCDLSGLARQVLNNAGVTQVYHDPHCSFRNDEMFYSYRREAETGRMAALIWIK